ALILDGQSQLRDCVGERLSENQTAMGRHGPNRPDPPSKLGWRRRKGSYSTRDLPLRPWRAQFSDNLATKQALKVKPCETIEIVPLRERAERRPALSHSRIAALSCLSAAFTRGCRTNHHRPPLFVRLRQGD